jgi:hypothetical protein
MVGGKPQIVTLSLRKYYKIFDENIVVVINTAIET